MSSFSQAQLDALETAIAQGVLTCEWEGQKVTYRSLGEMLRIRDIMRNSLSPQKDGSSQRNPIFDKGF